MHQQMLMKTNKESEHADILLFGYNGRSNHTPLYNQIFRKLLKKLFQAFACQIKDQVSAIADENNFRILVSQIRGRQRYGGKESWKNIPKYVFHFL